MTLSIWRSAHLVLAILSSLFLIVLSTTGIILAVDAVNEKLPDYQATNFKTLNLAQVVPTLRKVYPEIIEVSVDHRHFVYIDALDEEGNSVRGYIDPNDGSLLGPATSKSAFIQWVTALHRSLFLHETGRAIVGIVSFLLILISVSGLVLVVKRQQGVRRFFKTIHRDFFAQYFHVVLGRWSLLPILLIALTGTYLFLSRAGILSTTAIEIDHLQTDVEAVDTEISQFSSFQAINLSAVSKIEFPFIEGDPEEFFVLTLKTGELTINQIDGSVVRESRYPITVLLEKLSLDLHTGRSHVLLAIVLAFASANILFFIYSGFVITLKRRKTKVKNVFKVGEAEIVILVGSENGSTWSFAHKIHTQLLADGKASFIAGMNQYQVYPQAQQLLIFTATFGLGTAPSNASRFEQLLQRYPQAQSVQFSVVGFGSQAYADFCGYAQHIDEVLAGQEWATRYLPLHRVNDRSTDEFVKWVHHWAEKALLSLATAPGIYESKLANLKKFRVIEKTTIDTDNATFRVMLKPVSKLKFQSGDLLAIYPAGDHQERFYSIGRAAGKVQLVVKLHPNGLGSSYLYGLGLGDIVGARLLANTNFHFPLKAKSVVMIANGTGIAPFLGMISGNEKRIPIHLYAGFRHNDSLASAYSSFAANEIESSRLQSFQLAFSREGVGQYVMDLIERDAMLITGLMESGGVIMICGSLVMQKDVENVLETLLQARYQRSLDYYKERKQLLTDCY